MRDLYFSHSFKGAIIVEFISYRVTSVLEKLETFVLKCK